MFKKVTILVLALCAINAQAVFEVAVNIQAPSDFKRYQWGKLVVGGLIRPDKLTFVGGAGLEGLAGFDAGVSPEYLVPAVTFAAKADQGFYVSGSGLGFTFSSVMSPKGIVVAGVTYVMVRALRCVVRAMARQKKELEQSEVVKTDSEVSTQN